MTGRVHPARPFGPIPVATVILLVWWLVAHNSGSGWVQALGDVVFGLLAIGVFGPSVALWRARIQLERAPTDATAGLPSHLSIRASSRVRIRPIVPPGPECFIGPSGRRSAADSEVTLLPSRRGVHRAVVVAVATAAPFGLQWWERRVTLPLPAELHVAPRTGEPVPLPHAERDDPGDRGRRVPAQLGDARGVRSYRAGDLRRRVHWPATAHTARLMVREMEEPAAEPVTLSVSLPSDPDAAERVAERALGTAVRLLDAGARVVLSTTEEGGPVVAAVADRRDAGRRLARATPAAAAADGREIEVSR